MRHRKQGRKLGRTSAHRKAMFQNMARSLVQYEMIQTTDAKAKELRRLADHLITLAKTNTVHSQRQAFKILRNRDLVYKLFHDLGIRDEITSRQGGYCRILKVGNRDNDNAPISRISWVGATTDNTAQLRYPKEVFETLCAENNDSDSDHSDDSEEA